MAQALERYGQPSLLATCPVGTSSEAVSAILNVLDRAAPATSMVMPAGFDIRMLESQKTVGNIWTEALDLLDLRIGRSLLLNPLSGFSGGEPTAGSYSLGVSQQRLWQLHCQELRRQVESVLSESLLRLMHDVSGDGPDVAPPRLVLRPLTEDAKGEVLGQWNALVQSGAVTPTEADESHARELLGFPTNDEGSALALSERERGGALHHRGASGHTKTVGSVSPRVFSSPLPTKRDQHEPPAVTWRPVTKFEERAQVEHQRALHDDGARALGVALAEGTAALVDDLKQQVGRGELTPERVQKMQASRPVLDKMRRQCEAELLKAHALSKRAAVDELARARDAVPPSSPSPEA
jgi:hypothetical protein